MYIYDTYIRIHVCIHLYYTYIYAYTYTCIRNYMYRYVYIHIKHAYGAVLTASSPRIIPTVGMPQAAPMAAVAAMWLEKAPPKVRIPCV